MPIVKKDVIVIDNGTGYMKIGFAGQKKPEYVFSTLLGMPVVGRRAVGLKGVLQISRPVDRGRVRDWWKMEVLWRFSLNLLGTRPPGLKLFLTEPILSPEEDRERMAEVAFEELRVSGLYLGEQPLLAFYAHGGATGLVVDVGHGLTQIAPVWKGFLIPKAVRKMPLGGDDITTFLIHLLMKKGYYLATPAGAEVVKDIKERMCYVALDPEEELRGRSPADFTGPVGERGLYRLADGTTIRLGEELFLAPEVLFNPPLMGLDLDPLPKLILDSIMACDIDQRRDLLENIIVCGGTSLLKGLKERLRVELERLLREEGIRTRPRVVMPKLREFYAWMGASKLASLVEDLGLWVTREEYEEHGASIVNEKLRAPTATASPTVS
ncbi:hypothetical protein DRO32_01385 [Candidatus Bathyarchaeota archaeon]|nr:MAG: hypothetical protein DRO32_01385 [Candidatus Bathyarchaeota archaeon]